ncbi:hypothetical protein DFH28DRAFT_1083190 [Melampsora americana]|nr:hypothetical protein DFH28DRAFT_1083190 [Melampsora americana]
MFPIPSTSTRQNLIRNTYRHVQLTLIPNRLISINAQTKDITKPEGTEEEDDLLSSLTKRRGGRANKGGTKMSPREWLNSEEGRRFRDPVIGGTNWLGDDVPFPTNPWFKPKAPLWDGVRTKVYESFKSRVNSMPPNDPNISLAQIKTQEQILIRQTSEQWGISKDRISAIIKLKALEESWSLPSRSNREPEKVLQLNFEKGMENVLGVNRNLSKVVVEDVNELSNRKLLRKSKFFGFEFVPLDSPIPDPTIIQEASAEGSGDTKPRRQRYQEDDIPSTNRHIHGEDGIPRPPPCYISNPPTKVPMVFTDVSDFPRQTKPISKRKAKHFPRSSILSPYSQSNSTPSPPHSRDQRRSNSTLASMSVRMADGDLAYPSGTSKSSKNNTLSDEHKELVSELLRKFKGCSSSEAGMKMLDEFKFDSSPLNNESIKEMVLLRAGGLSFRESMGNWNNDLSRTQDLQPSLKGDEKAIQSMKYQMIKSIYMKKLELNQAGRLLLPEKVRSKQEKDFSIVQQSVSSVLPKVQQVKLRKGDRLLKQCMKGPAGRMKQRQLLKAQKSS